MNKGRFKNLKGLILATSVVVGTVIGTGIFFKNKTMISWAHGNAWIVISAWILGSIIAFAAAISFSQIAKSTKKSESGIGQLTKEMMGEKMGWHTKVNWAFYYFPWNTFLICLYASDYIIKLSSGSAPRQSNHTLLVLIIAVSLLIFFVIVNVIWKNIGNWVQISATIIKVMPLIILAIGAFIVVFVMPDTNWWNGTTHTAIPYDPTLANDTKGMKPLLIIIFIIPGTLFAYDSFINATNLSETVKKKHITYAIVGGMIFIALIYLLVTIAILSTGTLSVDGALVKLFGGNPEHPREVFLVLKKIVQMFILISALGSINGFSLVWVKSTRSVLKKKTTKNLFISIFISFLIITLPLLIITFSIYITNYVPKGVNASGAGRNIGITFADALSNPLIVISYTIYALTLLFGVVKNVKLKDKSKKYAKWFNFTAILSGGAIILILCYILFYSILYKALANSNNTFGGLPGWVFLLIVTFYTILWITLPFIIKKLGRTFVIDVINKEDSSSSNNKVTVKTELKKE